MWTQTLMVSASSYTKSFVEGKLRETWTPWNHELYSKGQEKKSIENIVSCKKMLFQMQLSINVQKTFRCAFAFQRAFRLEN